MKKSDLIAEKVFKSINNVVSTVENIHGDIAERKGEKNDKALHREEKREKVYGLIKSINGRVEETVRDFLK
ncbi:MAG: hypothetical protein LLG40_01980 [Deltaproteobacteria bacterium]|nr:hypothetical protein [Deltaproteobacteria bacterium]